MTSHEIDGDLYFSGHEMGCGRIELLSSGRAYAYPSPWIDIAPLRKGRRKTPLSNEVLLMVHALAFSEAASAASTRAMGPADSEMEALCHLRSAARAEQAASDARMNAVLLLDGPVEAARSTTDFHAWFQAALVAKFTPEQKCGVIIALKASEEAVRSESSKRLLSEIEKLTALNKRPPFRSELKKVLGIAPDEDAREFRRLLKSNGFDWLPIEIGKIGRPRKAQG